jgi:RimJ/RimL family protein N-acetyltransferase
MAFGLAQHPLRAALSDDQHEAKMEDPGLELERGTKKISVRALNPADAEAYHTVRLCALREDPPAFGTIPEDEPDLSETGARLAAGDDRCFFGAFRGEELIGIVRLSRYSAPNEKHRAYLAGLYVLPAFRRGGCGKALAREALTRAANTPGIRRVSLSVVTRQEAAIRLYQSLGLRIYGTEQETFSKNGVFYDEHLMTLELDSAGHDHGTPPQSELTGPA